MNTQSTLEIRPHVAIINGEIKTNSIVVAEHFGKRHADLLRAIESLECSPEFIERNFALIEVDVKVGFGTRKDKAYEITRDGFAFLVMGFNGKNAARWKEAYIHAFNAMAEQLQAPVYHHSPKALPGDHPLPKAITQAINRQAHALSRRAYDDYRRTLEHLAHQQWQQPDANPAALIAAVQQYAPQPAAPAADNHITIDLAADTAKHICLIFKGQATPASQRRYLVDVLDEAVSIKILSDTGFVATGDTLANLISQPGGPVSSRHLPAIIEAAARRLHTNQPARV